MELNSFLKQSKLYSRIVNNIDNKVSQSVFSATQGENHAEGSPRAQL